jgi:hypothetical protein
MINCRKLEHVCPLNNSNGGRGIKESLIEFLLLSFVL